ncbi:MAG: hypothetical protein NVV70_13965 [Cellulomonas sp.]|nr:hypothetical protein [Cellulomonas sp.]MCR6649179.1 hypothetical protein [Cellulomonas sp.]
MAALVHQAAEELARRPLWDRAPEVGRHKPGPNPSQDLIGADRGDRPVELAHDVRRCTPELRRQDDVVGDATTKAAPVDKADEPVLAPTHDPGVDRTAGDCLRPAVSAVRAADGATVSFPLERDQLGHPCAPLSEPDAPRRSERLRRLTGIGKLGVPSPEARQHGVHRLKAVERRLSSFGRETLEERLQRSVDHRHSGPPGFTHARQLRPLDESRLAIGVLDGDACEMDSADHPDPLDEEDRLADLKRYSARHGRSSSPTSRGSKAGRGRK